MHSRTWLWATLREECCGQCHCHHPYPVLPMGTDSKSEGAGAGAGAGVVNPMLLHILTMKDSCCVKSMPPGKKPPTCDITAEHCAFAVMHGLLTIWINGHIISNIALGLVGAAVAFATVPAICPDMLCSRSPDM